MAEETWVRRATREWRELKALLRENPAFATVLILVVSGGVSFYAYSTVPHVEPSVTIKPQATFVAPIGGAWENPGCKRAPYDKQCRTCEATIEQIGPTIKIKQCGDDTIYPGEFITPTKVEVQFGLAEGCCSGEVLADDRIAWSNGTEWKKKR